MLAAQLEEERRLFKRFEIRARVLLEIADEDAALGETENLSRGGVLLRTFARIAPGQRCHLRIPQDVTLSVRRLTTSGSEVDEPRLVVHAQIVAGNAVRVDRLADGSLRVALEFTTPLSADEIRDVRDRRWRLRPVPTTLPA